MRLKKGFKKRRLFEEDIITAEGIDNVGFTKIITLNGTASYLWDSISGKEFSIETLASLLTEKYEVEDDVAAKDARAFADSLTEAGLTEP